MAKRGPKDEPQDMGGLERAQPQDVGAGTQTQATAKPSGGLASPEQELLARIKELESKLDEGAAAEREEQLRERLRKLENQVARQQESMARFADVPAGVPVRVKALSMGYYDHKRMREGDVFTVDDKSDLGSWMEVVDAATPEKVTTGKEELRKQHDEIIKMAAPPTLPSDDATGSSDVMGLGGE